MRRQAASPEACGHSNAVVGRPGVQGRNTGRQFRGGHPTGTGQELPSAVTFRLNAFSHQLF
ncbi:hypothetical protein CNECB9_5180012 [Cupriavidus necator]|uniref:Uncharacterized protein n=1 Tax=Cupriavidus necator TaxID=106590 RepID=A0A1K0JIX1_CUPNE|nr:hypothetical protein CNECB9_5180012 [Cupriavidus necator]